MNLKDLVRPNIWSLKPYASARHEFSGDASIFLDANENPYQSTYNRYPDPWQRKLKSAISQWKRMPTASIFIGNGSDEAIDLLIRAFCIPGKDKILLMPPTYGMYKVCADISSIPCEEIPLTDKFQPDIAQLSQHFQDNSKLLFICSPNNPTGNLMDAQIIMKLVKAFPGIVVLDEAYIDFSNQESMTYKIKDLPNLVVLQTFSKALGMAGIRLGLAFADTRIVELLNKIKPPYNISSCAQNEALEALQKLDKVSEKILMIRREREFLKNELLSLSQVKEVFPSDANFLLVKFTNAQKTYHYLKNLGIVVRDRSRVLKCSGCLRITVGTPRENQVLLAALRNEE